MASPAFLIVPGRTLHQWPNERPQDFSAARSKYRSTDREMQQFASRSGAFLFVQIASLPTSALESKRGAVRYRCVGGSRTDRHLVLTPRPNIIEAQLAFRQFVEFSAGLYVDGLVGAENPDPDSTGADVECASGIALGTQDVQCFRVFHHWLLLL
jgi:hypothetical protein